MISLTTSANALAYMLPGSRPYGNKFIEGTNLRRTVRGLAKTLFVVEDKLARLIVEYFPDTTTELLTEWESLLGIPNAYFKGTGTLAERRAQVVAMIRANGAQTSQDFINLAALLGVTVTITTGGTPFYQVPPLDVPFVPAYQSGTNYFTWTCVVHGAPVPSYLVGFFNALKSADTTIEFTSVP